MECSISGCTNQAFVKQAKRDDNAGYAYGSLCSSHYHRLKRYGDPCAPDRRVFKYGMAPCKVDGCESVAKSRGLCEMHYARLRRRVQGPSAEAATYRANKEYKRKINARQEIAVGRSRPVVCDVCGEKGYKAGRSPYIVYDHNHATNAPRGWLCDRCNKLLGLAHDEIALLTALCEYLRVTAHGDPYDITTKRASIERFRATGYKATSDK